MRQLSTYIRDTRKLATVIKEADLPALRVQQLSHHYGRREALRELCLEVAAGEVFALLGPNGSGKSTLFRLTSSLARIQTGEIHVFGHSATTETARVRSLLGVVFQSPSLDPKLTALENIRCQAALYGVTGQELSTRIEQVAEQLGIQDRLGTPTEELSGGLKRRVELAKGILHRPRLLLMDEPSSGLDPASRLDMWHALKDLQQQNQVTVLLTTHVLEEADKADRIAILHEGQAVAVGKPDDLRRSLGEQVLTIQTSDPVQVTRWLAAQEVETREVENQICVVGSQAASVVAPLSAEFGNRIQTLTLGRPSLEDVFVARTGHRFWNTDPGGNESQGQGRSSKKSKKRR